MLNITNLYCSRQGESDHLRYNPHDNTGPVIVYNCTNACNLRCRHCYANADAGEILTTAEAKNLLHQLADVNCPVILFSGGEPLLREDIFTLLQTARKLNLRTVLSTNGTLINHDIAQQLKDLGVAYIGISIDGDRQTHEALRAVTGSFDQTISGIENCHQAGIKTGLRFTITKMNYRLISTVFDIAAAHNIRRLCFYHLIRSGRAIQMSHQLLTPDQTREAMNRIIDKTAQFAEQDLIDEVLTVGNHADGPFLLTRMQKEKHPNLQHAQNLLRINSGNRIGDKIGCVSWEGSVYPDQFWRNYTLGNIRDRDFAQIWSDETDPVLYKLRRKSQFADPHCKKCKYFDTCKGNYRFLGSRKSIENWRNEPKCYLTDKEITKE